MERVSIEKIVRIINNTIDGFDCSIADIDTDLSELGIDSLQFVQLIVTFEEVFECEIPDSKLLFGEMNTIRKIKELVDELSD